MLYPGSARTHGAVLLVFFMQQHIIHEIITLSPCNGCSVKLSDYGSQQKGKIKGVSKKSSAIPNVQIPFSHTIMRSGEQSVLSSYSLFRIATTPYRV